MFANSRSFASVIAGCILGAIVMKVRRLKGFIVAGTCLFTVAFGILYHFRGGDSGSSHSGIIAGEIILGIGELSLSPHPHILTCTDLNSWWNVPLSRTGKYPNCHQARA